MNWGEVAIALVVGLPGITVAVLAYRRSRKVDAVSEKTGIAANGRAGTAQVIEGLKVLIDNLQEDNKAFRDDIRSLTLRLDVVAAERDAFRLEVARLRKRYGDNGET